MAISLSSATPPLPPPAPPPASPLHHSHPLLPFLQRCEGMPHLKQIHAQALRTSSSSQSPTLLFLYSRLIQFSASTDLAYASRLLDHPTLPVSPNSFSFNALIRALARSPGHKHLAVHLFRCMLLRPAAPSPDNHTFPFVLKACAFLVAFCEGTQIHSHLTKLGLASDIYISNSLIHFYASCGLLPLARQLFDKMPTRSLVSWNVMIDGYVMSGEYETALELFREMQKNEFVPDEFTLQSAICASGGLGALSLGVWSHAFILKKCDDRLINDVLINNSLLDLYCKCGSISMARRMFEAMPTRDVASWNAIILGLAMHGEVKESLSSFTRMSVVDKLKPNSITFVAILSACNHGGLVSEGQKYFDLMISKFGIEPQLEHYGSMVDLLARAGLIDEALETIHEMPCKPDAVIWRSLLDAYCRSKAGIDVSESVARQVLESEEVATSGTYVLLSKVYASANRWNDVGLVRRLMTSKGIRKEPGCSSIEMDGFVHEFVAGDTNHPQSDEIYGLLNEVERNLASVGYRPDSSQALMVNGIDGAKVGSLRLHSERLAMAFGLLNMRKGVPIRILKNLRVCGDCHTMSKFISRVYRVEIVMRDRNRFHHFKDGLCSCMDYW